MDYGIIALHAEGSALEHFETPNELPKTYTEATANELDIPNNWQYDKAGNLTPKPIGSLNHGNTANTVTGAAGRVENAGVAHTMAIAVDKLRDQGMSGQGVLQSQLDNINNIAATRGVTPAMESARQGVLSKMDSAVNPVVLANHNEVSSAVKGHISDLEKAALEQRVQKRIEADRYPWTMPNIEIPADTLEGIKTVHEIMTVAHNEPESTDKFRIPIPMYNEGRYAPDDEILLQKSGISTHGRGLDYTRGELQDAGVFFINRVGAGEQPILGVPIPDLDSEGGVFNVSERTFLTREEFEKVYEYQQEHGYGIGGLDASDVQLDMLVFAVRPEQRRPTTHKDYGFGSRENKYGIARSPFVDSGVEISSGVEPSVEDDAFGGGHAERRINTMSLHIMNGHPDYPGLSEMFDPVTADHDQRYMSPGEYTRMYYHSLPNSEQVLRSMQTGIPTARERAWVGALPE